MTGMCPAHGPIFLTAEQKEHQERSTMMDSYRCPYCLRVLFTKDEGRALKPGLKESL